LHVDLRRAALRAEGPPVLDHRATLFAGMIHSCETSAEQTREQGIQSWDRPYLRHRTTIQSLNDSVTQ
jgi:hypothetical protein